MCPWGCEVTCELCDRSVGATDSGSVLRPALGLLGGLLIAGVWIAVYLWCWGF